MTLIKHELKQSWKTLTVWTLSISFFIVACVYLFPEMKGEMNEISGMFSSMGIFTAAFGMDKLDFGTLIGFYGIECGNVLGIGGALFASLIAVSALAKEEKDRTAEFLLTHPVSRTKIISDKLAAIMISLVILNIVVYFFSIASIAWIGEEIPWKEVNLLHLAYFLVQVELAGLCFGISAFLRRGGLGIGLGIAIVMYFFNLLANISESAEFLRYVTPFGFAESADIVSNGGLDWKLVGIGMTAAAVGIGCAYWKYRRKDIQ